MDAEHAFGCWLKQHVSMLDTCMSLCLSCQTYASKAQDTSASTTSGADSHETGLGHGRQNHSTSVILIANCSAKRSSFAHAQFAQMERFLLHTFKVIADNTDTSALGVSLCAHTRIAIAKSHGIRHGGALPASAP
eukprot:1158790-Pelagomonas_calceolata.AAC.7